MSIEVESSIGSLVRDDLFFHSATCFLETQCCKPVPNLSLFPCQMLRLTLFISSTFQTFSARTHHDTFIESNHFHFLRVSKKKSFQSDSFFPPRTAKLGNKLQFGCFFEVFNHSLFKQVKGQFLSVILNVIIFTSFSIHITHFIQLHHFNCQRLP